MPIQIGSPKEFDAKERARFIAFVASAGEVDAAGLPGLVDRAHTLIALYDGEDVVGSAALKHPNAGYRARTFEKADVATLASSFALELGWVHVHPAHRRQGHARALIEAALAAATGEGIYATTKSAAMRTILNDADFATRGAPFASALVPEIELTLHCRGAGGPNIASPQSLE